MATGAVAESAEASVCGSPADERNAVREKGGDAFALVVWAVGARAIKGSAAGDGAGGVATVGEGEEAGGCNPSSSPANEENGPSVMLDPTLASTATGVAPAVAVVNTDAGTTKVCIQRIE